MHAPAYLSHAFGALSRHTRRPSTWIVLGLGAAAALAHATFRFPLHLPGRHGIEWMALLVIARGLSSYRWAATLAATGAALVAAFAMHDPLAPLAYLVPGVVLDAECLAVGDRLRHSVAALGALAAVAHAAKPIVQWMGASALGSHLPGAGHGLAFIIVSHAAFGLAGGIIGALLWRARHR
jgi:hypothetical protein